jgi:hypothetical protein
MTVALQPVSNHHPKRRKSYRFPQVSGPIGKQIQHVAALVVYRAVGFLRHVHQQVPVLGYNVNECVCNLVRRLADVFQRFKASKASAMLL